MPTPSHFRCRACGTLFTAEAALVTDEGYVRCPDCPTLDVAVLMLPVIVPDRRPSTHRNSVPPVEVADGGAARYLAGGR